MQEDDRARLLCGRPELVEALVPGVVAVDSRRQLHARQPPVSHELAQLVGSSRVDGAERRDAPARHRGERLVLTLGLASEEVHPRAEHDDVDPGAVLFFEDPREVDELARRGADLASGERDDLRAVLPRNVRADAADDHMRERANSTSRRCPPERFPAFSWPRSLTIAKSSWTSSYLRRSSFRSRRSGYPPMRTFSRIVIAGKSPFDCGTWTMPARRMSGALARVMSCPSSRILPTRIRRTPLTARSTVDLPAPFGPTMHVIEPLGTSRSTPCKTSPPP